MSELTRQRSSAQVVRRAPSAAVSQPVHDEERDDEALDHDVAGNHAALRGMGIRPKLMVGGVNDPEEREADALADRVMRMPEEEVVRRRAAMAGGGGGGGDGVIRRKAGSAGAVGAVGAAGGEAPESVRAVLAEPGRPLDKETRAFFEPRFGVDLGGVRVREGEAAQGSADGIGATAYTVGADVVMGRSGSPSGGHEQVSLLAHELAHVVTGAPLVGSDVIRRDSTKLSFEAEQLAQPGGAGRDRVAALLGSLAPIIHDASESYRVDKVAIAGAIAWEALHNIPRKSLVLSIAKKLTGQPSVRATGLAKFHSHDVPWTGQSLGEELESKGYIEYPTWVGASPSEMIRARREKLREPLHAVRYVAAAMSAFSDIAQGYGFNIGDRPEILTWAYQSQTLRSWSAHLESKRKRGDLAFDVSLQPPEASMAAWLVGNRAFLANALKNVGASDKAQSVAAVPQGRVVRRTPRDPSKAMQLKTKRRGSRKKGRATPRVEAGAVVTAGESLVLAVPVATLGAEAGFAGPAHVEATDNRGTDQVIHLEKAPRAGSASSSDPAKTATKTTIGNVRSTPTGALSPVAKVQQSYTRKTNLPQVSGNSEKSNPTATTPNRVAPPHPTMEQLSAPWDDLEDFGGDSIIRQYIDRLIGEYSGTPPENRGERMEDRKRNFCLSSRSFGALKERDRLIKKQLKCVKKLEAAKTSRSRASKRGAEDAERELEEIELRLDAYPTWKEHVKFKYRWVVSQYHLFTVAAMPKAGAIRWEGKGKMREFAVDNQNSKVQIPDAIWGRSGSRMVLPAVVDLLEATQGYCPNVDFKITTREGGDGGHALGYAVDVTLRRRGGGRPKLAEDGLWDPDAAVEFLSGVRMAAKDQHAEWTVLYNDHRVIEKFPGHAGYQGSFDKKGRQNWHGPFNLHMHLEIYKVGGAELGRLKSVVK